MSLAGSSSGGNRSKASSPVASLPVALGPRRPAPLGSALPLVPCPCCQMRRTVRCVSRSVANPGRVFYKCPNHGKGMNPCNHYYWEDGEDNYVAFLIANGFIAGAGTASVDYSGGDFRFEAIEEEIGSGLKMDQLVPKMEQCLNKMDQLIVLCRHVITALVVLIAIMLYVAVAK
ncbi:uncharacterized protein LOC123409661 [Hordeum vulgare subsp. vulgare]|uniref:GRF-type domain-containing protein n=1 Tax=Hordeum vulgare subsp. vulgare TaxID=112509 RepID=A0A287F9M6_HORVV|nr:uncharacterized protein LOC123409661 [Hordeum vulgare subsp. vulgare]